ncbi:MAG: transporter substrate-binding domain-containing protein [Oligoflexales bacterium]
MIQNWASKLAKSLILLAAIQDAAPLYARTFEEIKKSGELKVATRNRPGVSQKVGNEIRGFHYCLMSRFAKDQGLKLVVEWRTHDFLEYFKKPGYDIHKVMTDPSLAYMPEYLEHNDIGLDGFNFLPWREKLGDYIKLTHARQIVVYNKNKMKKPDSVVDLAGKTVVVNEGTSQHSMLKEIAGKYKINIVLAKMQQQQDNDLEGLISGKADFAIYPSTYALHDIKANGQLGFGFAIGDSAPFAWMIAKNNPTLAAELNKFVKNGKENGTFDTCFKQEYGISYNDYLRSLSILDN